LKNSSHAYERLLEANYPLSGASDHGVSEAIYLDDPDSNGLELYWDKPIERWPRIADGSNMYTRILDEYNHS
jgi:catechol 2,3-dioxygenase